MGPDTPTYFQTPPEISANPLGSFSYIVDVQCMYMVSFTAHLRTKLVRTTNIYLGWRHHCGRALVLVAMYDIEQQRLFCDESAVLEAL